MIYRRQERTRLWFRAERVFRADGEWFIHTREGMTIGPYEQKFAADVDAEVLASTLSVSDERDAEDIVREFMFADGRSRQQRDTDVAQLMFESEVARLLDDGFGRSIAHDL